MNIPTTQALTLISLLDTYRTSLKPILSHQGTSISDSLERNEIVEALRLSNTISKAVEEGTEVQLRVDELEFIERVLEVENKHLQNSLSTVEDDEIEMFCISQVIRELKLVEESLLTMKETQTQPSPQQNQWR